ncbi:MAG TPA: hypothetical protein VIJ02_10225, partial [Thermoanaerobaculia bacterium]
MAPIALRSISRLAGRSAVTAASRARTFVQASSGRPPWTASTRVGPAASTRHPGMDCRALRSSPASASVSHSVS